MIIISVYLYFGFIRRFDVFSCVIALLWCRDLLNLICVSEIYFVFDLMLLYCMSLWVVAELVFLWFLSLVSLYLSCNILSLLVHVVYLVWVHIFSSIFQYIHCFHLLLHVISAEKAYTLVLNYVYCHFHLILRHLLSRFTSFSSSRSL